MSNTLDLQIQDHLRRYVTGGATLSQFEDWLVSATWDVDATSSGDTAHLTAGILLLLAEYSNGDWTEPEIKRLLAPFMETDPAKRERQVQSEREQVYFEITGTRPVTRSA